MLISGGKACGGAIGLRPLLGFLQVGLKQILDCFIVFHLKSQNYPHSIFKGHLRGKVNLAVALHLPYDVLFCSRFQTCFFCNHSPSNLHHPFPIIFFFLLSLTHFFFSLFFLSFLIIFPHLFSFFLSPVFFFIFFILLFYYFWSLVIR